MKKTSKIVVTIVATLIVLLMYVPIVGFRTDAGYQNPGILALIVFCVYIGALRAVWKKDSTINTITKKENKDDDSSILQK